MTVGDDADACAAEPSVTVPAGRRVYVCYIATNTGDVTFTNHLISDQSLDPIYAAFAEPLPPGERITKVAEARVFEATTTINDVWTANNSPDGVVQVQAGDSVEVRVVNPDMEVKTTVGAVGSGCADATTYQARQGTRAQFCVHIKNTGDTPLAALQITVASQPANAISVTGTISAHDLLPLAPDGVIDIVDPAAFGSQLSGSLVITSGGVTVTATSTVRAATVDGFPVTPLNSSAVMRVGRADAALTPSINTAAECGTGTSISPLVNQPFYYCLRVQNTGTVPLTEHVIRSVTPRMAVTFTYALEPQAGMAVNNAFLAGLPNPAPAVMGPHFYTSATTVSTSFVYTAGNSAGFTVTKTSGTVSAGVTAPTATPTHTPTPTEDPPTNTPWPTLSATPTWTPFPTSTPTWTPVTPSATPTRDWNASFIATPTPNPALAAGAPVPDFNATNAAVQMTADAAALATNAALGMGATSPFDTPTPFFGESPFDPYATPDTLSMTLPLGTPTPRALFFLPTPTQTITPTAVAAGRPLGQTGQAELPGSPPAAPSGAGRFIATVFDATVAAAGLLWFAAGTVIFFGAAGIMAALIWRDAARSRARRRARAYDLEPEAPFTSSIEPAAPPGATTITPAVTPPAGAPPAAATPRARPPAQDDTHWPASLP